LEHAAGISSGFFLTIRALVFVVRVVVLGRLRLIEEVVHPVRRRVDKEKQKYRSAKPA